MLELTEKHAAALHLLRENHFEIVAFPMYANHVGIRRGECALLLAVANDSHFQIFGEPSLLLAENISVRVKRDGKQLFVWKKNQAEATPARLEALAQFRADVLRILASLA
ncbi:MAG: hypothetical protein WB869_03245 [Candidatus Acidiferrales bacterium]|jgi:hypothetical protein